MRKERRIAPRLESLESMTLLSGVAAAVHQHQAADVSVSVMPPSSTISLQGQARGFYLAHQNNADTGTTFNLFASGRLGPLGRAVVNGSFTTPGFIRGGTAQGTLHVHARGGSLDLQLTQIATLVTAGTPSSTNQFHFAYTVTGGTGDFEGDSGSGTVDVSLRPFVSFRGRSHGGEFGRVSMNFHTETFTTTA